MITFENTLGGRLGENINFIYGMLKIAKETANLQNCRINKLYKSINTLKHKNNSCYVFLDNMEMFENIKDMFIEIDIDKHIWDLLDLNYKYNIVDMRDYFLGKNYKDYNLLLKNYWVFDMTSSCPYNYTQMYDLKLLNWICRPDKLVMRLYNQYKDIFKHPTHAIHFRRGDFCGLINKDCLSDEVLKNYDRFFVNKILFTEEDVHKRIRSCIDYCNYDTNILVFSDDFDFINNACKYYNNVYPIHNRHDYEDFVLMSMCDTVAWNPGSSFSFIAAILSCFKPKCLPYREW